MFGIGTQEIILFGIVAAIDLQRSTRTNQIQLARKHESVPRRNETATVCNPRTTHQC